MESRRYEMTTAEDGTFPLVVIDENHLGYFSDTDQDANVEYVEYILSTTTLKKPYNPTGSPAVYNFSSLTLKKYFLST